MSDKVLVEVEGFARVELVEPQYGNSGSVKLKLTRESGRSMSSGALGSITHGPCAEGVIENCDLVKWAERLKARLEQPLPVQAVPDAQAESVIGGLRAHVGALEREVESKCTVIRDQGTHIRDQGTRIADLERESSNRLGQIKDLRNEVAAQAQRLRDRGVIIEDLTRMVNATQAGSIAALKERIAALELKDARQIDLIRDLRRMVQDKDAECWNQCALIEELKRKLDERHVEIAGLREQAASLQRIVDEQRERIVALKRAQPGVIAHGVIPHNHNPEQWGLGFTFDGAPTSLYVTAGNLAGLNRLAEALGGQALSGSF